MAKTKLIELPPPQIKGKSSLEEAIFKRRSQRSFAKKDLSWEEISQLLWSAQGITGKNWGYNLRAAPSAGALYPMEVYLLTQEGLFHYLPEGHRLEVLKEGDLRGDLASAGLGQDCILEAPVNIILCVVYRRVTQKYGQRGIRYVHLEVGHVAQNILLQAQALGLGSVPIGAFNDSRVKSLLALPQDHEPIYTIPLGYPD